MKSDEKDDESDEEKISVNYQKKINDEDNSSPVAGASTQVSPKIVKNAAKKDKCRYGAKCYQKSKEHKQEYSHPGDPGYEGQLNCKVK